METLVEVANQVSGTDNPSITLKDGTEVVLRKCRTKDIGPVLKFAAHALEQMDITSLSSAKGISLDNPAIFLNLIANSADELCVLAARLSSLSKDQMEDLEVDDSILIFTELFTINKDFFSKSILPLVRNVLPASRAAKSQ